MKDKVSELRKILNRKKSMDAKKHEEDPQDISEIDDTTESDLPVMEEIDNEATANISDEIKKLTKKYDEIKKANETQKEMYLRKVADFDNFKKRMEKEHGELVKYANEKVLEDLFPVIDSLEMTLAHVEDEDDPIAKGVNLILKQFLRMLEKHGVKQIAGEGEEFDPNLQEAIGTEKSKDVKSGHVVKVHRKGYTLNGKLIRAAMVTVAE